jgi:hypothetical protein
MYTEEIRENTLDVIIFVCQGCVTQSIGWVHREKQIFSLRDIINVMAVARYSHFH